MMFQNIFFLHGTEGSKPHMQGHICCFNALFLNAPQQFLGKMQPRGRCSGGTLIFCIYRLVAVLILELMGNVGRQRHLPQPVQHFLKNPLIFKADQAIAFFHRLQYLRFQETVTEHQSCTGSAFFSGLYQCLPDIILTAFQ